MNIFRSDINKAAVVLSAIPVFALCVLIFILSAQEGSSSDVTSGQVVDLLPEFISSFCFKHFGLDEFHTYLLINSIVRTGAHFCEFALLSALFYFHVTRYLTRFSSVISFAASLCYCISDEIHQIFVPGRTCQFVDILIDSAGILSGIIFCLLIKFLFRKLSSREKN